MAGMRITAPLFNRRRSNHPREWFGGMPVLDDPDYVLFQNDFLKATDYSTTDFTLTLVGSGTSAVATTTNEKNGALVLTTGASSGDSSSLQSKQECWKLEAGKELWFEANVNASNVADVDMFIGLAQTDTTPLDAADRVGFRMATGSAVLKYESSLAASATSVTTGVSAVAATYNKLGFYWDGQSVVKFFVDRNLVASITTNIPTAQLALTAHVKTNSANARVMLIDYAFGIKAR